MSHFVPVNDPDLFNIKFIAQISLACAVARSLNTFGTAPLSDGAGEGICEKIQRDPAFHAALERAVRLDALASLPSVEPHDIALASDTSVGRFLIFSICMARRDLELLGLFIAGIASARQIIAITSREERRHARAVLGTAIHDVALYEALPFYPALVQPISGTSSLTELWHLVMKVDSVRARIAVASAGVQLLSQTLSQVCEALAQYLAKRLPVTSYVVPAHDAHNLNWPTLDWPTLVQFLKRRFPLWAHQIA